MYIVAISLIFKMPCVDLEGNAPKTQKTEFYKAQWAKFDPFFSNLGLFKSKSRPDLPLYWL